MNTQWYYFEDEDRERFFNMFYDNINLRSVFQNPMPMDMRICTHIKYLVACGYEDKENIINDLANSVKPCEVVYLKNPESGSVWSERADIFYDNAVFGIDRDVIEIDENQFWPDYIPF